MSQHGTAPADRFEPDPAVGELCLALFGVMRGLRQAGDGQPRPRELLERYGLAPRHVAALAYLAVAGPISVSVLAERLGVARTTASLLVAELAAAGLVDRSEDRQDHRRTIVTVSPTHQFEVREMIEARLVPIRRAVAKLGPECVAVMTAGLRVLAGEVERGPGDAGPGGGATT